MFWQLLFFLLIFLLYIVLGFVSNFLQVFTQQDQPYINFIQDWDIALFLYLLLDTLAEFNEKKIKLVDY